MRDRDDEQSRGRGRQADSYSKRGERDEPGEFDRPGAMKVPTGESGGSGAVRGDSGIQSGSGLSESGGSGIPSPGLSEDATRRSEERDTGSAPGSRDFSHVSDMGETGLEGPVGGTAGVTGYMGKTGVVGRPPDMAGSAGVADTTGNPEEPAVPRYHTGKRSGGNVGGPTGAETGPGGLKGEPPEAMKSPSGGTPGVHGHSPSGGVAGGSEPPKNEV